MRDQQLHASPPATTRRGCHPVTAYVAGFEDTRYQREYANPYPPNSAAWHEYEAGNQDARRTIPAYEVVSKQAGTQIVTRHFTDKAVLTEMQYRCRNGHTGVDWRAVEIETSPDACQKQARPGQQRQGGKR